jgi:hypothetical protein
LDVGKLRAEGDRDVRPVLQKLWRALTDTYCPPLVWRATSGHESSLRRSPHLEAIAIHGTGPRYESLEAEAVVVDGEGAQVGTTGGDAQVAPELGCLF